MYIFFLRYFGLSALAVAGLVCAMSAPADWVLAYRDAVLSSVVSPHSSLVARCSGFSVADLRLVAAFSIEFMISVPAAIWFSWRYLTAPWNAARHALAFQWARPDPIGQRRAVEFDTPNFRRSAQAGLLVAIAFVAIFALMAAPPACDFTRNDVRGMIAISLAYAVFLLFASIAANKFNDAADRTAR